MSKTKIEWAEQTWNPVRGCSLVSLGCVNCYAMRQAHRFNGPGMPYEGLTKVGPNGPTWTGRVVLDFGKLDEPLHRRRPTIYFVNSMSDLFHERLLDDEIGAVFEVMARAPQHVFQVLTKRAARMESWTREYASMHFKRWPFRNIWLGVSAEDQQRLNDRVPHLLSTAAAVRFVSVEPLLGPLSLSLVPAPASRNQAGHPRAYRIDPSSLDWVIIGGESGPNARAMDIVWAHDIVRECQEAEVPCFVKQLGAAPFDSDRTERGEMESLRLTDRKGGDSHEWPERLRVRQMPRST